MMAKISFVLVPSFPLSLHLFLSLFQNTWEKDGNILVFDKNVIHNPAWFPNPQKLTHRDNQSFIWLNHSCLEGHNHTIKKDYQGTKDNLGWNDFMNFQRRN